jgi:hypothetical protein
VKPMGSYSVSMVSALILTQFRKTAERIARWLSKKRYQALFFDLPEDLTPFIRRYVNEEIPLEELWRSYSYLTGLQEPFINALRYTLNPIINVLIQLKHRIPRLEVYCYADLESHLEASRFSERLLLLETGERVRRRIKLNAWRELLRDELELSTMELRWMVQNITEEAEKHSRNAVLYGGMVKPFKVNMEDKGFKVEPIYLQRYWRSPLEVLRTILWVQGIDDVPDEVIVNCVKCHLKYLDYVLSSEYIDTAHGNWTVETQPNIPQKAAIQSRGSQRPH